MNIGEKIRYLRIKNDMTQEELAQSVGTKKQTIHKYESGIITNIPASKVKAMADNLGTTVPYLMGWEDSSADISFKKKEFIKRVESMTDDELDRLEQILALVEGKE